MLLIKLQRAFYSELVVRKALYWCSSESGWTLQLQDDHWLICVKTPTCSFEEILHKHLNDFLLREKLDKKTRSLREEIIKASLQAVVLNVREN